MHKPSLTYLVYKTLFPRPTAKDPPSFAQHVTRNIVPEVRLETTNFYGALDCVEAQYPGLDYSYSPHRQRLWRFPWHRKLLRAFDELGLTSSEINTICQWEGTLSAKEKYEKDAGRKIRDTTMDCVASADIRRKPVAYFHDEEDLDEDDLSEDVSDDGEGDIRGSCGVQLNEQLRAAADAQARGEPVVFDEQWEQWMKEALERNELGPNLMLELIREGRPIDASLAEPSPEVIPTNTHASPPPPQAQVHVHQATSNFDGLETQLDNLAASVASTAAGTLSDRPAAEAR